MKGVFFKRRINPIVWNRLLKRKKRGIIGLYVSNLFFPAIGKKDKAFLRFEGRGDVWCVF
ncbi:MAG: hypothetical protein COB76_05475 [Alphaproteobacteria bacterium]|nr:MAG: hypothetical protein COB76_05475 [Alphaproteobacteria bacterium]